MSATRFPTGISTNKKTQTLGEFGLPDMTSNHVYMNDFDIYTAAEWTVTDVGAATQAVADEDGGILVITNAAADDNSSFLQLASETYLFEAGKETWFKARFKISDATESEFVMGLQITDTTPLDCTDGVFFQKADGAATVDFIAKKDNTASTASAVATLEDDTYFDLGFYYDGKSSITAYFNNAAAGSVDTTNLPDDEELTISFGIQNGEAVAKIMSVDYIMAAKKR